MTTVASHFSTRSTPTRERYQPGPSREQLAMGAVLRRGDSGEDVRTLQRNLNAAGAQPPLAEDGLFGPKTEAALRAHQSGRGLAPTGTAGLDLLDLRLGSAPISDDFGRNTATGSRSAPRIDAARPQGALPAAELIQQDRIRRMGEARVSGSADEQLRAIQERTIGSARRELDAGVHEDLGDNRGRRVDQYARRGNMPVGGEWCGYFTGFNYDEAAREAGGRFNGINGFHSMQKARSYFEYRSYTDNSAGTNRRLDDLRAQHERDGSTRRWMVLEGSGGHRHATTHNRPHEVFQPNTLPIRAGDTALFSRGHVGLVESYDQRTGQLTTIEGNAGGGRVRRRSYDLNDPQVRAGFEGFGRPARGDFEVPNAPREPSEPRVRAVEPAQQAQQPAQPSEVQPSEVQPSEVQPSEVQPSAARLNLPARADNALTGSQFLEATRGMSRAQREDFILDQIRQGNVPEFARQMREIPVRHTDRNGVEHTGTVRVMPDYLAIGSNDDFVRVPMSAPTAQRVADLTGASLPTRKLVNDVYQNAEVRLNPQPLPPGAQMMSSDYYLRHQQLVEQQRQSRGGELGALTAGHKKDLVITNRLEQHPDRVAIYGWHQPNGRPIQGLSTIHEASYADYSHGVRLVGGTMMVDGQERPIAEVLRDPNLAGLVSDEGVIRNPRVPRS